MIGCLMYFLATRPDKAFLVCLDGRYMDMPTKIHVAAAKRILRYIKGTTSHGIFYKQSSEKNMKLVRWTNSDYTGDYDDR